MSILAKLTDMKRLKNIFKLSIFCICKYYQATAYTFPYFLAIALAVDTIATPTSPPPTIATIIPTTAAILDTPEIMSIIFLAICCEIPNVDVR